MFDFICDVVEAGIGATVAVIENAPEIIESGIDAIEDVATSIVES